MNSYKVIGLMSGSSLDGLDIAGCEFRHDHERWSFRIDYADTIPYDEQTTELLKEAITSSNEKLELLDREYGKWTGERVGEFCEKHNYLPEFVASHGHTIRHEPEKGITVQIGNGKEISDVSGFTVINDFRSEDVSKGGQGAPLVPIGDKLLFDSYTFCLNLGGIANISLDHGSTRIAYDICPANMILNHLTESMGIPYDDRGSIARTGKIHNELLKKLNALDFYGQPYPKSLGREWAEEYIFPTLNEYDLETQDMLHTYVHHIADQLNNHLSRHSMEGRMLVTGGGSFNDFLMETIEEKLPKGIVQVVPNERIVAFKEAMIFAFLGVLRIRNEVNCLSSVTGAQSDSCSGTIYTPNESKSFR